MNESSDESGESSYSLTEESMRQFDENGTPNVPSRKMSVEIVPLDEASDDDKIMIVENTNDNKAVKT